jgi:hypothetical protein
MGCLIELSDYCLKQNIIKYYTHRTDLTATLGHRSVRQDVSKNVHHRVHQKNVHPFKFKLTIIYCSNLTAV